MGKANVSRQALVEAIATLEAQRGLTGDDRNLKQAVDVVLMVLREKLAQVQTEPGDQKRHQLAVLVADLSGYTALSERMDVERVRDAINAMWSVLDAVIHAWGGQIDQHAGDSLMALFGLPHPRQGDAARALHAALSMQQELRLFNERVRQAAGNPLDESWAGDWPGPSMRIGVHSGLVYFAHAPSGSGLAGTGRATAVGDTVVKARRLEKLAPAGSVLTSQATRRQAHSRFNFTPTLENAVSAEEDDEVFMVAGERPLPTGYIPGSVAGKVARLVARTELLDRLQMALQTAADTLTPQLVTIVGAPGAGKSRLVHEFEGHAHLLSGSTRILRAGTQGAFGDFPYALVRDLLLRRFSIRPQQSRYLVEHRLRQGLWDLAAGPEAERDWQRGHNLDIPTQAVKLLEKLLDARTAAMIPVDEVLAVVEPLLRAITAGGPAIVILEGINRADYQSLDLVHRLVRNEESGPVLFLGLATMAAATNPEWMLPWLSQNEDIFSPVERLDVPPLSPVDSRLMATEILGPLSPPPMRLLDLVVAEAGGNPLYIEEFVRLLLDRGVITTGERWRVDMDRVEKISLPSGLSKLLEYRLAELTAAERKVLQYAAVFGPLCWDTALIDLIPAAEIPASGVEAALLSLEMKDFLANDDIYSFAASQAYAFRRDSVRETAYGGIPAAERRSLHLEAAHWLIANQDDARLNAWFSIDTMIAGHFAAAGDTARAETWQKRAVVSSQTP